MAACATLLSAEHANDPEPKGGIENSKSSREAELVTYGSVRAKASRIGAHAMKSVMATNVSARSMI
jgi:hypothetical protein